MPPSPRDIYNAASAECRARTAVYKPAAAFEVHNGITGIAAYYKFPGGLSASDYERRIKEPATGRLAIQICNDWKQLKLLNPALRKVRVDTGNPWLVRDAVRGAAALLNVDDLNFYIGHQMETGSISVDAVHALPGYAALYNDVAAKARHEMIGWVPAPRTLERMKEKLATASAPTLR